MKYVLICPEIIKISITNNFQSDQHILIEKVSEGVFQVIKNAGEVQQLFNLVKNCARSFEQRNQQCQIIVYSSKNTRVLSGIISSIDAEIAKRAIYINFDNKKYGNLKANRAQLKTSDTTGLRYICYGQGCAQLKSKAQLRMAIQCCFKSFQKGDYFIFQSNQEEKNTLLKEGFRNVFDCDNLKSAFETIDQVQITSKELSGRFYEELLKSQRSVGEVQEILKEVQSHILKREHICDEVIRNFICSQKLAYEITPKSTCRAPFSQEISSFIFKNSKDCKLYVARASKTKDVGGEYHSQILEQISLVSKLPAVFQTKGLYSLPHQKSLSSFCKHSLIKAYEQKKGQFIVKPYLEGLSSLGDLIKRNPKSSQLYQEILSTHFYGKQLSGKSGSMVRGFGQLLFFSYVTNESLRVKPLFEQISLICRDNGAQNMGLVTEKDQIDEIFHQKVMGKEMHVLRFEYFEPLQNQEQFYRNSSMGQDAEFPVFQLLADEFVCLDELSAQILREILNSCLILENPGYILNEKTEMSQSIEFDDQSLNISLGLKLLEGYCKYYKWQFNHSHLLQKMLKRSNHLLKAVMNILKQRQQCSTLECNPRQNTSESSLIHSSYLNTNVDLLKALQQKPYLFVMATPFLSESGYGYFTQYLGDRKKEVQWFSKKSLFESEQQLPVQNPYAEAILQNQSFQVYGQMPAVFTLLSWIHSRGNHPLIEYVSFLNRNKIQYQIASKRLKLQSTNDKKKAILIVDHAQECEQIFESNRSIRTVFLTHFKKGEHQLLVLDDHSNQKQPLLRSKDQIISTLIKVFRVRSFHQIAIQKLSHNHPLSQLSDMFTEIQSCSYMFKLYHFVFNSWIEMKCEFYGFDFKEVKQFCYFLHELISMGKNRFKDIISKKTESAKMMNLLPVYKENQKIYFAHQLQSYIELDKLWAVEGKGKILKINKKFLDRAQIIDSRLVSALKQWSKVIQPDLKIQLLEWLLSVLKQNYDPQGMSAKKLSQNFEQRNLVIDCLDYLTRPITSPYGSDNIAKKSAHLGQSTRKLEDTRNLLFLSQEINYSYNQTTTRLLEVRIQNSNSVHPEWVLAQSQSSIMVLNVEKMEKVWEVSGNFKLLGAHAGKCGSLQLLVLQKEQTANQFAMLKRLLLRQSQFSASEVKETLLQQAILAKINLYKSRQNTKPEGQINQNIRQSIPDNISLLQCQLYSKGQGHFFIVKLQKSVYFVDVTQCLISNQQNCEGLLPLKQFPKSDCLEVRSLFKHSSSGDVLITTEQNLIFSLSLRNQEPNLQEFWKLSPSSSWTVRSVFSLQSRIGKNQDQETYKIVIFKKGFMKKQAQLQIIEFSHSMPEMSSNGKQSLEIVSSEIVPLPVSCYEASIFSISSSKSKSLDLFWFLKNDDALNCLSIEKESGNGEIHSQMVEESLDHQNRLKINDNRVCSYFSVEKHPKKLIHWNTSTFLIQSGGSYLKKFTAKGSTNSEQLDHREVNDREKKTDQSLQMQLE